MVFSDVRFFLAFDAHLHRLHKKPTQKNHFLKTRIAPRFTSKTAMASRKKNGFYRFGATANGRGIGFGRVVNEGRRTCCRKAEAAEAAEADRNLVLGAGMGGVEAAVGVVEWFERCFSASE